MRPVNLIPPDQRRGSGVPLRRGPLAYVLVGGLVAVLLAVTALILVGNQVSEREAEVATLAVEDAEAREEAERLSAYTEFRGLSEGRVETVANLAESRFDWERVMRELALILPDTAWLTSLNASAAPGAGPSGGGSGLRAASPGPALELSGCATGQVAVAGFVTALEDIEGVTRVGVQSSELPGEGGGGSGGGGGAECRTRPTIAKFEIVVVFDAAPVPATAAEDSSSPVATTEPEVEGEDGESAADGEEDAADGEEEEG